jgi:hypothetical protein
MALRIAFGPEKFTDRDQGLLAVLEASPVEAVDIRCSCGR